MPIGSLVPNSILGTIYPPSVKPPTGSLRAVPPSSIPSVGAAVARNLWDLASTPSTPVSNVLPAIGQDGSANNQGNIAGASGNLGYAVQTIGTWQAANPTLGLIARIGLPAAGILLWAKGHHVFGGALAVASVPFWMSR
jgi:hypothetical protein